MEMIILHTVLVLRRLNAEQVPARARGQALFDTFCRDMDANLREMGVGDLAVPRRMQQIGEAFYGRQAAYEAALAADDRGILVAALARNVFGAGAAGGAVGLAAYVRETVGHLAAQDIAALSRGECGFPEPAAVAAVGVAAEGSKI